MNEPTEIERTSLDAHVSLCALRYSQLERRLESVETSLKDVYTLLSDIRDRLAALPAATQTQTQAKWEQFQWWVIAVLLAVVGWSLGLVFA
jgi:septation ring formation regulator EzrA